MKKISFRVRNFDKEQFLTFNIDNDAELDEDLLDYIEDEEPDGIVPVIFEEDEEFDTFSYDITDKIHLCELSAQEINAEMVLMVLRGIVISLMNMSEYRIPLSYLVLNRNYIYIDSDYKVEFVCIPIEDMKEEVDLTNFFRNFIASLRFDPTENGDYVAKLLTYVNNRTLFNLHNLLSLIEEWMDNMGIDIPDDNNNEIYGEYQEVVEDDTDDYVQDDLTDNVGEKESSYDEDVTQDYSDVEANEPEAAEPEEARMEEPEVEANVEADSVTGEQTEEEFMEEESEVEDSETTDSMTGEPEVGKSDINEPMADEMVVDKSEAAVPVSDDIMPDDVVDEDDETTIRNNVYERGTDKVTDAEGTGAGSDTEEDKAEVTKAQEKEIKEEEIQEEKVQETRAQETRAQETRAQETRVQETRAQETKAQATKTQATKTQATKAQEVKPQENNVAVDNNADKSGETVSKDLENAEKPASAAKEKSATVGVVIEDDFDQFLAEKELEDGLSLQEEKNLKIRKHIKVNRASIVQSNKDEIEKEQEEDSASYDVSEETGKLIEEPLTGEQNNNEEAKKHDKKSEKKSEKKSGKKDTDKKEKDDNDSEEEELRETGSLLSQTIGNAANTIKNAASVSSVPKVNPYLIRVNTDERIMITKQTFKLGKASMGVDYSISGNSAISRVHAVITGKDGEFFIKDNKSTNHTFVDGKNVEEGESAPLKNNCKIVLGDEEFIFKLQ